MRNRIRRRPLIVMKLDYLKTCLLIVLNNIGSSCQRNKLVQTCKICCCIHHFFYQYFQLHVSCSLTQKIFFFSSKITNQNLGFPVAKKIIFQMQNLQHIVTWSNNRSIIYNIVIKNSAFIKTNEYVINNSFYNLIPSVNSRLIERFDVCIINLDSIPLNCQASVFLPS